MENYVLMYRSSRLVKKKNLNSLNVKNRENPMQKREWKMYKLSRFVENFEFVESTKLWKFNEKWKNVQIKENLMENCVH